MRIVVCDDDEKFLEEFRRVLEEKLNLLEIKSEFSVYNDGRNLIKFYEWEKADALFLDIDMPNINGFEIAELVRKKDSNCMIVFCSNYSDLVFETFQYEPFAFLCKLNYQEKLLDILNRIYDKWNSRKKELICQKKGNYFCLKQSDIMYIDTTNHKIFIHTNNTIHEFRGNLSSVEEKLDVRSFVKINSGCIVNLEYIFKIHENLITLKNKEILTISRSNKKKVKDKFFDFIGR